MKSIVALQRGHIVVGDVERDGPYIYVRNASEVEFWCADADKIGRGIGRLARTGPIPGDNKDRVYPCPDLGPIHELTVVYIMEAPGWK